MLSQTYTPATTQRQQGSAAAEITLGCATRSSACEVRTVRALERRLARVMYEKAALQQNLWKQGTKIENMQAELGAARARIKELEGENRTLRAERTPCCAAARNEVWRRR